MIDTQCLDQDLACGNANNSPAFLAYKVFPVGKDIIDAAMSSDLEWRRWGFYSQEHYICRDTHAFLKGGMVESFVRKLNAESISEPSN